MSSTGVLSGRLSSSKYSHSKIEISTLKLSTVTTTNFFVLFIFVSVANGFEKRSHTRSPSRRRKNHGIQFLTDSLHDAAQTRHSTRDQYINYRHPVTTRAWRTQYHIGSSFSPTTRPTHWYMTGLHSRLSHTSSDSKSKSINGNTMSGGAEARAAKCLYFTCASSFSS